MKAIIHSFHSQVPDTISEIQDQIELESILSVDAHLDLGMIVGERLKVLSTSQRLAAERAMAHLLIRRTTGDLSALLKGEENFVQMTIVCPRRCIETDLATKEKNYLKYSTGDIQDIFDKSGDPIDQYKNTMGGLLGVTIYDSPPKSLVGFAKQFKGLSQSTLFDIDVDYIWEMQGECYTPIKGSTKEGMGSLANLLWLIGKVKPETLTISEAKVDAIVDKASTFNRFLRQIGKLGYSVSFDNRNFKTDSEAEEVINWWPGYWEKNVLPFVPDLLGHDYSAEL